MGRKSKAIAVPYNEPEFDELMEIHFKKLMRETKNKRHKLCMKIIAELNPDDFTVIKDLAKTVRKLIIVLYIEICELEKQRDEAQSKLKEYQDASKS